MPTAGRSGSQRGVETAKRTGQDTCQIITYAYLERFSLSEDLLMNERCYTRTYTLRGKSQVSLVHFLT